jgi:opacity protein-like surface antigen
MRKMFVFVVVLVLSSSACLLGQAEQTGYELGVYVSQQNWKARSFQIGPPQAFTPIPLGFRYNDHVAYGIRANLLSQGHWAGELSYSYQRNTATLTRQSFTPVALPGAVHHFFYNEVFYPVRYGPAVVPFITGGIGLAAYQLSDEARARAADPRIYGLGNLRSTDKRVALNYGAGVKANIVRHFGVRGDFRHIFSDVPSYGIPKESPSPFQLVLPIQGKLQTYEFSFGIYFRALYEGYK